MAHPRLSLREALALGVIQGPTELLPVSSSAHTTLLPWLAGWPSSSLDAQTRRSLEIVLHTGAGLALALALRGELLDAVGELDGRRAALIALSLLPPAIAGLTLQDLIERHLSGPRAISAGLLAGAVAMAGAEMGAGHAGRSQADAGALDGLALGLAQTLALAPGVSRSGATLTAARMRGFRRADARALSWHAALPVIFGASALNGVRLWRARRRGAANNGHVGPQPLASGALAAGGASAFLSTLAAQRALARTRIGDRSLVPFALYRCALAALVLARVRRTRQDSGEAVVG